MPDERRLFVQGKDREALKGVEWSCPECGEPHTKHRRVAGSLYDVLVVECPTDPPAQVEIRLAHAPRAPGSWWRRMFRYF